MKGWGNMASRRSRGLQPVDQRRRLALASIASLAVLHGLPVRAAVEGEALRIGLTPVFLDDQAAFLRLWQDYLATRLERPVEFVHRGSYREVYELIANGRIEFAWLCGFPYVRLASRVNLLVTPLYEGKPLYRSYLIVPASDTRTRGLLDLRDGIFAYSDPDSNSGFLYPNYYLLQAGENPEVFFRRTFYTWAHRKVVDAVASGLAQAGAVDGYVWDTLALYHPELTARTRVAARSPEFGFPPLVAGRSVPARQRRAMREVLLGMADDGQGRQLLARLNLDGFSVERPELFDSIAAMWRATRRG
jgi:phosphonate transport system substrate-binding protein